jgi:hypothetical protein
MGNFLMSRSEICGDDACEAVGEPERRLAIISLKKSRTQSPTGEIGSGSKLRISTAMGRGEEERIIFSKKSAHSQKVRTVSTKSSIPALRKHGINFRKFNNF